MFLKFITTLYSIKLNFRYLPKDIQCDFIQALVEFEELCKHYSLLSRISKERSKK